MIELNTSGETFAQALRIHKESFSGPELAPTPMFQWRVNHDLFFTTTVGDDLAGYAIVEDRVPFQFIWEIAVAPKYRRQGVGSRLIDEIIEWAKNKGEHGIELTVRRDNEPAILLYMTKDFYTVRLLKRFYLNRRDGVLMRRDI
jgi:[ribosomal protein S18]-alanine N-acetyltransferase